ncbi:prevent-host-death protein [Cuspidothrix issatschenkoi]|uniref:prevent-host-death protein n=1 Tax=Cuspidothrix issatschenkoi TaxID=230752 RepID=UPI001A9C4ECE|nr:prevent-host-death protein [Cuspidothrix issatschenkoi]
MKGYIKEKTVIVLEELPDSFQEGDEVEVLISTFEKNDHQQLKLTVIPVNHQQKRDQPGLHLRAISTSDDFDEPLPDEFWLGES